MEFYTSWYFVLSLVFFLWAALAISMAAKYEAIYIIRYLMGKEEDKEEFATSLKKIFAVSLFSAISLVVIVLTHNWWHGW